MKKFLLSLIALLAMVSAKADTFAPILSDGKSWVCESIWMTWNEEHPLTTRMFKYEVAGERIIGDKECKVVKGQWLDNGDELPEYTLLEEDGKLYLCGEGYGASESFLPLIDMTLGLNDEASDLENGSKMKAIEVNVKTVKGEDRKELVMVYGKGVAAGASDTDVVATWVEGIGSSSDNFIYLFQRPADSFLSWHMMECYDNGELIFTNEEFSYPIAGIKAPAVGGDEADSVLFDLFGRRVASPCKGRLYITSGGKKLRF